MTEAFREGDIVAAPCKVRLSVGGELFVVEGLPLSAVAPWTSRELREAFEECVETLREARSVVGELFLIGALNGNGLALRADAALDAVARAREAG